MHVDHPVVQVFGYTVVIINAALRLKNGRHAVAGGMEIQKYYVVWLDSGR